MYMRLFNWDSSSVTHAMQPSFILFTSLSTRKYFTFHRVIYMQSLVTVCFWSSVEHTNKRQALLTTRNRKNLGCFPAINFKLQLSLVITNLIKEFNCCFPNWIVAINCNWFVELFSRFMFRRMCNNASILMNCISEVVVCWW